MFNDKNIIKIDDWFWTQEDVRAYNYLKESHKDELDSILPHLSDHKTAVQAGAHCGFVIQELLPHFETIYTFEPDNTMFTCLCLNIPEKNVYKFQACLGEQHKMVDMAINPVCPQVGGKFVKGEGIIPMLTIDDLVLKECSLIMLDIEGNEYNALLGAQKTIEKFHPLLCMERYWETRYNPGSVINEFLDKSGYKEVARTGENKQDFIYKWKG